MQVSAISVFHVSDSLLVLFLYLSFCPLGSAHQVAAKRAKDMADDLARQLAGDDEEDPLDAFMAAAVMPEVQQRQAEEEARRAEERRKLAEQLAAGKGAGLVGRECKEPNMRV